MMRLRFGLSLIAILACAAILTGCGGGSASSSSSSNPTVGLKSIAVSGPATAYSGQTGLQYTATGSYDDGSTKNITTTVTWSSNVNVVTVNTSGVATAVSSTKGGVAPGATHQVVTLTATLGSVKGVLTGGLTVSDDLSSIVVTPAGQTVTGGSSQQYTATGTFQDGTTENIGSDVTWSASPSGTATISSTGLATGSSTITIPSEATIKATSNGTLQAVSALAAGSTSLTVDPCALVSIVVNSPASSLTALTVDQLTATGTYQCGGSQVITKTATWSVTATNGGTVSMNWNNSPGAAYATYSGVNQNSIATIQAQVGSVVGSVQLPIVPVLDELTIGPVSPGMLGGGTQQFGATGVYNDGTTNPNLGPTATWSSVANNIVSFGAGMNGMATAGTQGVTTVSASMANVNGASISGSTVVNVVNSTNGSSTLADGNYAFTLLGANNGPVMYAGSFTAQGSSGCSLGNSAATCGNIIGGEMDVNTPGQAPIYLPSGLTGSYVTFPDGRGLLTFNQSEVFNVPGGVTFRFILSNSGTLGKLMEFDGQGTMKGTMWQQTGPVTAALNGNYVFRASGVDGSGNPLGEIGYFNTDGTGITGGTIDIDDYSIVSTNVALSASTVVSTDQNGRGKFYLTQGSTTSEYAFYVITAPTGAQPSLATFVEIDSPGTGVTALAGTMALQQGVAGGYSADTLQNSGGDGYGFLLDRPIVSGNCVTTCLADEFAQAGEYTFTASSKFQGTLAGVRDDTNPPGNNPFNLVPGTTVCNGGSGTGSNNYSFGGNIGRGVIQTCGENTSGIIDSNRSYVIYMVSSSQAYVLQNYTTNYPITAGSYNAPTGEMDLQSGNFSLSTLNGAYALDASGVVVPGLTTEVMWLYFDGTGNINGVIDQSTGASGTNKTSLASTIVAVNDFTGPDPTHPNSGRTPVDLTADGTNDLVLYLVSPQLAVVMNGSPAKDGMLNSQ